MQKIAIIQISDAGSEIASQLQCELGAELIQRTDVGNQWAAYDAFVFIGAMGICVRTIAPYIEDKHTDPAVVCIDSFGLNVISVLSGHIGGANDLTRHIAAHLGAHADAHGTDENEGIIGCPLVTNIGSLDEFGTEFALQLTGDFAASIANLYDGYFLHDNISMGLE